MQNRWAVETVEALRNDYSHLRIYCENILNTEVGFLLETSSLKP